MEQRQLSCHEVYEQSMKKKHQPEQDEEIRLSDITRIYLDMKDLYNEMYSLYEKFIHTKCVGKNGREVDSENAHEKRIPSQKSRYKKG